MPLSAEEPANPHVARGRRGPWRTAIVVGLQIACVAFVARLLFSQRAELGRALDVSAFTLLLLLALMFAHHLQRTYEFIFVLRRLGVHEPFRDGFWLTGAGFLLNQLPLNAGLVMRGAVLKQDHALPYASYLAVLTVNGLVNLAVAGSVGLVAVAFGDSPSWFLALLFAGLLLGPVAVLALPARWVPSGGGFVLGRIRALSEGMSRIRGNGLGLLWLALLSTTKVALAGARMAISFGALGVAISLQETALLATTTIVFSLLNVTPGNLGLRELALAAVATEVGSSYAVGAAAASVDRVVLLAYTVLTGLPGVWSLRRRGPFTRGSKPVSRASR